MLTATAWLPEQPLISETIGKKTASAIIACSVSWYIAITLAAIMFSTIFTLNHDNTLALEVVGLLAFCDRIKQSPSA
jgi:hypothetical protein